MSDLGVVEGAAGDLNIADIRDRAERQLSFNMLENGAPAQTARDVLALVADREALLERLDTAKREYGEHEQALQRENEELLGKVGVLEGALRDDPSKWSFDTLVAIARLILDADYPADIFTGTSGDPGPAFVAHLRAALAALPESRAVLAGGEACDHEWIDIRNAVVKSGEMCRKCGLLRAGNAAGGEVAGQGEEES